MVAVFAFLLYLALVGAGYLYGYAKGRAVSAVEHATKDRPR